MDILITDLTLMRNGEHLCVAGWSAAERRMVRPLPGGRHWSPAKVQDLGLVPGVTLRVYPSGKATGAYPHRTEDLPIDPHRVAIVGRGYDWGKQDGPEIYPSVAAAFEGKVQVNSTYNGVHQGAHVAPDTHCRSLAGIVVPQEELRLFVDSFKKLKARVDDGESAYKLAVTSKALHDAWLERGISCIRSALPNRSSLYLRLGLARPFGDPPKCYMMLNGVL